MTFSYTYVIDTIILVISYMKRAFFLEQTCNARLIQPWLHNTLFTKPGHNQKDYLKMIKGRPIKGMKYYRHFRYEALIP